MQRLVANVKNLTPVRDGAPNDTDDWAHDGYYDRVLDACARIDGYISELWSWIQSDPEYRGHTHLLITADHGRGRTPLDWREVPDCDPANFTIFTVPQRFATIGNPHADMDHNPGSLETLLELAAKAPLLPEERAMIEKAKPAG
jgi:hypothetical protein